MEFSNHKSSPLVSTSFVSYRKTIFENFASIFLHKSTLDPYHLLKSLHSNSIRYSKIQINRYNLPRVLPSCRSDLRLVLIKIPICPHPGPMCFCFDCPHLIIKSVVGNEWDFQYYSHCS